RSPCTSWTTLPLRRSIEGMSMRNRLNGYSVIRLCRSNRANRVDRVNRSTGFPGQAHRYAARVQMLFEIRDGVLRVMEDRGRQRRVGSSAGEHIDEVLERSGAAGGNHRDLHSG